VKQISSSMTRFQKGVVPVMVMAGVFSGVLALVLSKPIEQTWWALTMATLFSIAFGVAYRFRIWPLADEVFDCGDHLLVRRRGEEQRIRLEDIAEVDLRRSGKSQHRMVLSLRREGPFGATVVFLAPKHFSFNPFAKDPLEEDLHSRVEAARRRG